MAHKLNTFYVHDGEISTLHWILGGDTGFFTVDKCITEDLDKLKLCTPSPHAKYVWRLQHPDGHYESLYKWVGRYFLGRFTMRDKPIIFPVNGDMDYLLSTNFKLVDKAMLKLTQAKYKVFYGKVSEE